MPEQIAILYGHPDQSVARLCHALSKAYEETARETGHIVKRIDVGKLEFRSVLSSDDFQNGAVPMDIKSAQSIVSDSNHLCIIYPLWLGTMPGKFKMFLEQLFRPGFALDYSNPGFPGKMLTGKSADVIITMGMPTIAFRGFYFSHSVRNLKRNILEFCGIEPVKITYIGGVEQLSPAQMRKQFAKVRKLAKRP